MSAKGIVFVGLSGGVDSSVAAHIAKRDGHTVIGAFIKIAQSDIPGCTSREDRISAMRVAATLGIPFREIDLSEAYREKVITHFLTEYQNGYTPNPDVFCNNEIKFKLFANWAFKEGADYIATGHYARKIESGGDVFLRRAKDYSKDQTYFLWGIETQVLKKTLFLIGDLKKSEVRDIAKKNNLHTSSRPDSQGLCFLGDIDVKEFLKKELQPKKGPVCNMAGEEVGVHPGAALFTVGERHGFSVHNSYNNGKPYYITAINLDKNLLTVSQRIPYTTSGTQLLLRECNWFEEVDGEILDVQFRHLGALIPARVEKEEAGYVCTIKKNTHSIACGQSAVFFRGDLCLGGGIVARIL